MIATLPMYDRPEAQAANDRFWALIRAHLPDAPETLSRDGYHWVSPDLLLSQTCSLPYRTGLQEDVRIVATPVHNLECEAGLYYSVVLVRETDERGALSDFAGARLAINSPISQSGWAAIDAEAQAEGLRFGSVFETGAHAASARAVAEERADLCAVDAVTWKMISRWDDFAKGLRVLCTTQPTPALPYITAIERDPMPLQEALVNAVHELSADDRETLCLIDMAYIPPVHYVTLPIPPTPVLTPEFV
ncbi:MAG: phosphate/phosphite/phosphonate ABC transporter substrate-binding protein [Paracoccaceae bacterium]